MNRKNISSKELDVNNHTTLDNDPTNDEWDINKHMYFTNGRNNNSNKKKSTQGYMG